MKKETRGKGYFVCLNEGKNHIIMYDLPYGVSIESFAEKTPCKECGAKIAWHGENFM